MNDEYKTKDLHLASFLKVKGSDLLRLEQYSGGVKNPVYFVFSDNDKCSSLESVFWDNTHPEVQGSLKDYFDQLRDLRSRVYSIIRQQQNGRPNVYET